MFFVLSLLDILTLHFTIIAGLLVLVSSIIFVITSRLTSPPDEQQVSNFTFHRRLIKRQDELCWWQDYRIYSLLLIILAMMLVIAHW
jgi:hypothetical protein